MNPWMLAGAALIALYVLAAWALMNRKRHSRPARIAERQWDSANRRKRGGR